MCWRGALFRRGGAPMELVTGIMNLATALLRLIETFLERRSIPETRGRHFVKRSR